MPRPVPTFHDFVGQKKTVDLLRRQLAGAQTRGQPFPHTLFTGSSGLGKTLLAEALAAEYGTKMTIASGDIGKVGLVDRLTALETNDFLFLDEAQALKAPSQELLYEAIDNSRVPCLPGSQAANAPDTESSTTVAINRCTIMLATDQPGRILNALQKRMSLRVPVSHYSVEELKEIVDRMATSMNLLISPQAARLIAKVAAGVPRRVKHHLQNLQNHFPNSESEKITLQQVKDFLAAFDIDEKGLGSQERQYLQHLSEAGSASLESLAISIGLDCDFVRRQVEPLLLRESLVTIGPGGRRLTAAGQQWISETTTEKD